VKDKKSYVIRQINGPFLRRYRWCRRSQQQRGARSARRTLQALSGRRCLLVECLVPLLLVVTAPQASAHPTLLSPTPAAGYSVASTPPSITMVFDEPVGVAPRGVRVEDGSRHAVDTSDVIIEQGGRRLVVNTLDAMSVGRHVVRWEVTAQDGDVVAADFDFAVATGRPAAALSVNGSPAVPYPRRIGRGPAQPLGESTRHLRRPRHRCPSGGSLRLAEGAVPSAPGGQGPIGVVSRYGEPSRCTRGSRWCSSYLLQSPARLARTCWCRASGHSAVRRTDGR
jgi:methionine-rich copper-binding protein CopC